MLEIAGPASRTVWIHPLVLLLQQRLLYILIRFSHLLKLLIPFPLIPSVSASTQRFLSPYAIAPNFTCSITATGPLYVNFELIFQSFYFSFFVGMAPSTGFVGALILYVNFELIFQSLYFSFFVGMAPSTGFVGALVLFVNFELNPESCNSYSSSASTSEMHLLRKHEPHSFM